MEVKGVATNKTSGSGMNSSHGGSNHTPPTHRPCPGMARNQPHSYHPAFDDS